MSNYWIILGCDQLKWSVIVEGNSSQFLSSQPCNWFFNFLNLNERLHVYLYPITCHWSSSSFQSIEVVLILTLRSWLHCISISCSFVYSPAILISISSLFASKSLLVMGSRIGPVTESFGGPLDPSLPSSIPSLRTDFQPTMSCPNYTVIWSAFLHLVHKNFLRDFAKCLD